MSRCHGRADQHNNAAVAKSRQWNCAPYLFISRRARGLRNLGYRGVFTFVHVVVTRNLSLVTTGHAGAGLRQALRRGRVTGGHLCRRLRRHRGGLDRRACCHVLLFSRRVAPWPAAWPGSPHSSARGVCASVITLFSHPDDSLFLARSSVWPAGRLRAPLSPGGATALPLRPDR